MFLEANEKSSLLLGKLKDAIIALKTARPLRQVAEQELWLRWSLQVMWPLPCFSPLHKIQVEIQITIFFPLGITVGKIQVRGSFYCPAVQI